MRLSLGMGRSGDSPAGTDRPGLPRDLLTLAKPRIVALVLVATAFGYLMAPGARADWVLLTGLLLGTLLVGTGGNALNQYIERDRDKLMARTRDRPLPAGRLTARSVLIGGSLAAAAGVTILAWACGWLAGAIALSVVVTYVLCYTPLKSRSELNTLVGAVPGALPPVLGWAAATGTLERGALALFLIMFVWQLPHFISIAWIYREDYASAQIPMITVIDPDGSRTRRQLMLYSGSMILVSLYPTMIGMAGALYFFGALCLSAVYFAASALQAWRSTERHARLLLRVSLIYLPLLFGLMLYDLEGA